MPRGGAGNQTMRPLEDDDLDALLATDELPAPPDEVVSRALRTIRDRHQPNPEARQLWLARLAQVREEFKQLLSRPELAGMALATRGGAASAAVIGDEDAAIGHAVQGNNIRGQLFLTALESPADLEAVLRLDSSGEVVETTRADDVGRFRFLGLEPGTYRMEVPELGLAQVVEIFH